MLDRPLEGRCILVVEDEYLIAEDLRFTLESAGAEVLGPVADVGAAAQLIDSGERLDGALLDINLRGSKVFDFADVLVERGVPFAFASGYDRWAIPDRFAMVPQIDKPIGPGKVAATLRGMMG